MKKKLTEVEKLAKSILKPVNKTPTKRHKLNGVKDGVSFTSENQPSPEAKSKGWQKIRQERHLTQEIIKLMIGDDGKPTDTFKGYLRSLAENAKKGNAKAIEVIQKSLEDDIQKIAFTDGDGNDKDLKLKIDL